MPGEHNHPKNKEKLEREKVREACQRRAVADIGERASKVVYQEASEGTGLTLRQFQNLKNSIYRARQKQQPAQSEQYEPRTKTDVFEPYKRVDSNEHDVLPRAVGSDITWGQEVLRPGQRLGPAELGLLATVGVTTVQCYAVPTVGVMSTGNEVGLGQGFCNKIIRPV